MSQFLKLRHSKITSVVLLSSRFHVYAQLSLGISRNHLCVPVRLNFLRRYSSCHDLHQDLFRYSGGRWLWDEGKQLKDRYKRFNVLELQNVAVRCAGAQTCTSITKLAEGGFNKVFRLVMNNGLIVIARIPNPNAGPAFRIIASEVATMDFARTVLKIPVPKVLAWSSDADNPVDSEYILMEEARGRPLSDTWHNMDLQDKFKLVEEIVETEKKLLSVSFTLYGNLFYAANAFPGCQQAVIEGDIDQSLRESVRMKFVIGPVVDREFWNGSRAKLNVNRGPWKRSQDYIKAICHREITRLSKRSLLRSTQQMFAVSAAQNNPESHIELYRKLFDVSEMLLPQKAELVRSTLWHWDVHAPNIFIEDNKITGLIDWQDVWAGPLALQAHHPRLIMYSGETMLKLPEYYEKLVDEEEKARIRLQVERSLVSWVYESETKEINPVLDEIYQLAHWHTRRNTVEFAANTWNGDILPFRQCLIRIVRHWNEIDNQEPCPISFTDEDIRLHQRDAEGWNEEADFWESMDGFVTRDGWTSNEDYDQALRVFTELREKGLKTLTGDELRQFEQQTRWASR